MVKEKHFVTSIGEQNMLHHKHILSLDNKLTKRFGLLK